jgi:hypothetical protein
MLLQFEIILGLAEKLCAEFCNFSQRHIFANYLTFAINEWKIGR